MSPLLQFLLLLAIIVVVSKYAGAIAIRIGQPAVFGQILVGLLLGPTFLNILSWGIFSGDNSITHGIAPHLAQLPPVFFPIKMIAEVGVILLMFLAGLETDLKQMRRVGSTAIWAAVGGVVGPFLFGALVAYWFFRLGLPLTSYGAIFIGAILTATSVSISAQTLMELKQLRSREGTAIIGAAVVDDVLGLIILSLVIAFKPASKGVSEGGHNLLDLLMNFFQKASVFEPYLGIIRMALLFLLIFAFVGISYLTYHFILIPVFRNMSSQPVQEALTASAFFFAIFFAWMAEYVGSLAAITGSYLCGVMLAQTPFRHDITEKTITVTYGIFVSIFFVSIGMEANVREIFAPLIHILSMTRLEWLTLTFAILILLIAIFTKVVGCLIGAKFTGFSLLESYRVGVGMISRGEVGLIVASVGYSSGIIQQEVFSTMILIVLVTTLVTPIWLRQIFPRPAVNVLA